MAQIRTHVRRLLAQALVRAGAWEACVWKSRTTPIDGETHFPNVCIYTQAERTKQLATEDTREQELSLLVEVRMKRRSDRLDPYRRNDGLPEDPAQTGDADDELDDACDAIERIVFLLFNNTAIDIDGERIAFDAIAEINTDLSHSGEGEVPYLLAQLEFKLIYRACFPAPDPDTCPLEHLFGEISARPCDPDAVAQPIGVAVHPLQPPAV